jgi:CRISP-associated protein Cas1
MVIAPMLEITHHERNGSPAFVLEPERPKVDRAVLDFVKCHVLDPADFVIRSDGVCRLNPEMARRIAHEITNMQLILD